MLSLPELGITKEELQERVVEKIAEQLLGDKDFDEDGCASISKSTFHKALEKRIADHVEVAIMKIADAHILPNVSRYIDELCLQETNKWGEKKGVPLSFIEYLVQRAESYLREEVSYEGKTKVENGSYCFTGAQTRITYLVHEHLKYTIESAMKDAVKNVNGVISGALAETCKIQLANIASSLKVNVVTKG